MVCAAEPTGVDLRWNVVLSMAIWLLPLLTNTETYHQSNGTVGYNSTK